MYKCSYLIIHTGNTIVLLVFRELKWVITPTIKLQDKQSCQVQRYENAVKISKDLHNAYALSISNNLISESALNNKPLSPEPKK